MNDWYGGTAAQISVVASWKIYGGRASANGLVRSPIMKTMELKRSVVDRVGLKCCAQCP
jgi:hypothetical protein